jgi:hypothetical protein
MRNNAGFFPATDAHLTKWGELMLDDIKQLDILLSWQDMEKYIMPMLSIKDVILNSEIYNPYMYPNPWSKALEGKKVLVVSPFADTISRQYRNRDKLFQNKDILPEFDLRTVKSFNILRGKRRDAGVKDWFEALLIMEERIEKCEFDIALLGCGAYAFHLGAFVKRMKKTAVTLCGSLQLLFGIYGTRYEKWLAGSNLLNEYWVRPSDTERPAGWRKVENGAYW